MPFKTESDVNKFAMLVWRMLDACNSGGTVLATVSALLHTHVHTGLALFLRLLHTYSTTAPCSTTATYSTTAYTRTLFVLYLQLHYTLRPYSGIALSTELNYPCNAQSMQCKTLHCTCTPVHSHALTCALLIDMIMIFIQFVGNVGGTSVRGRCKSAH